MKNQNKFEKMISSFISKTKEQEPGIDELCDLFENLLELTKGVDVYRNEDYYGSKLEDIVSYIVHINGKQQILLETCLNKDIYKNFNVRYHDKKEKVHQELIGSFDDLEILIKTLKR
jgi:hypothetical protein